MPEIKTMISPKYVKDWSTKKAIREILQNHLDCIEEFRCSGEVIWTGGFGSTRDFGPGLELRHLALGISEKGGNSIGQFGEGLKLAMLVFARDQKFITIHTGDKQITPRIEYDPTVGTDLLVFDIKNTRKLNGTRIDFACTEEEMQAGQAYFITFRKGIKWIVEGNLSEPPGDVYVNGSLVGHFAKQEEGIPSLYSYHFTGEEAKRISNRDREIVDSSALASMIAYKLANMTNGKVVSNILRKIKNGVDFWESRCYMYTSMIHVDNTEAIRVWKENLSDILDGCCVSTGSPEADNQLSYRGYKPIRVGYGWETFLVSLGLRSGEKLLKENIEAEEISLEYLSEEELSVLDTALMMVRAHYADPGDVYITKDLLIGVSSGMVVSSAHGKYDASSDKIFLAREVLADLGKTLKTLLHETCHKVSGELDCTPEFQNALCLISVDMMLRM